MPYITIDDVRRRIGPTAFKRIYDDQNLGTEDANAVDALRRDASSMIDRTIQAIYDLPLAEPYPDGVVCLTLDAAEYLAARRHPEYVKRDWRPMYDVLMRDLDELRKQHRTIGKVPPDPAANQGGAVYPTPDPSTGQNLPIFSGGGNKWGIF